MNRSNNTMMPIALVRGAMSLALPCVSLSLEIDQEEYPVFLLPNRTVYVPEWLEPSLCATAVEEAKRFEKEHRIVIHELLKCAQREIAPKVTRREGNAITTTPTLSHAKELVFRMALEDTEVTLHVSRRLVPCQIHLAHGERCNSKRLFEAYDLALEYMQRHADELEAMGFDTSILRLSVQDWLGYRERMRIT